MFRGKCMWWMVFEDGVHSIEFHLYSRQHQEGIRQSRA